MTDLPGAEGHRASARLRGKRWTGLYRDAKGKQRSAGTFDTEREAIRAGEDAEDVLRPPVEAMPGTSGVRRRRGERGSKRPSHVER